MTRPRDGRNMDTSSNESPPTIDRPSENRYREAIEFDYVGLGSHCVDCYPGGCPYHVFVKDGKIIREEIAPIIPHVDKESPDLLPMGCNKGAAWSAQIDAADRIR